MSSLSLDEMDVDFVIGYETVSAFVSFREEAMFWVGQALGPSCGADSEFFVV